MHPDQPAFVYASIAINPLQAAELHSELIKRFKIEGKEFKGKRLVKQDRGKKAISWLLKECKNFSRISISQKKYALACKFFEYIFEPVLAPRSSTFYAIGFNKFIATLLYVTFQARRDYAEDILIEFEALMKTKDISRLETLLSPVGTGINPANPIGMILTFALCHRERITQEIKGLADMGSVGKWVLELTTGALFGLLSYWGEKFEEIDVHCDKSKPLETDLGIFNVMIGRREKIYQRIGTREFPIAFNLSGPIKLVESHTSPGIQIADILASAIAAALKNPSDNLFRQWLSLTECTFDGTSVFPNTDNMNLNLKEPFINTLILHELVERTIRGKGLFDEMDEFISMAEKTYKEEYLLRITG